MPIHTGIWIGQKCIRKHKPTGRKEPPTNRRSPGWMRGNSFHCLEEEGRYQPGNLSSLSSRRLQQRRIAMAKAEESRVGFSEHVVSGVFAYYYRGGDPRQPFSWCPSLILSPTREEFLGAIWAIFPLISSACAHLHIGILVYRLAS